MKRTALSGVVWAGVCVLLMGCTSGAKKAMVPIEGPRLGPEYGTRVEVENWRGPVTVVANRRAAGATVRAWTRKDKEAAREAGVPAPKTAELRGLVSVKAVSGFEGGKPVLRVTSRPTDRPTPGAYTQLEVEVPAVQGITVRTAGGDVFVDGVSGPVTVENGTGPRDGGDVQVRTGAAMTDPVSLSTTGGHVLYQVGPGSTGRFDLLSEKGVAEFTSLLGSVNGVRYERDRWRGVLDGGENAVVLHSARGDVVARVMQNAGTYGPEYWRGDIEWPSSPGWVRRMGETMKLREPAP